jgi:hypothetical protein
MRHLPTSCDAVLIEYPALSGLGLRVDAPSALAQQGFLSVDRRGDKQYAKLRFRLHGKQRVKYVRPEHRAEVSAELERLQAGPRLRSALRAESRKVRSIVKESEATLQAALEKSGFHFHGRKLRLTRRSKLP